MPRKIATEDMQQLAKAKGGECLASQFPGSQVKVGWRCNKGHEWLATWASVQQKTWCPHCNGNAKGTIEQMHALAKQFGGSCLSTEYRTERYSLEWECALGHTFSMSPRVVRMGNWCQHCSTTIGERLCRYVFQQLTEYEFKNVRPDWLLSSTGTKLELDGYCPELKLAFEHHGQQHYKWVKW